MSFDRLQIKRLDGAVGSSGDQLSEYIESGELIINLSNNSLYIGKGGWDPSSLALLNNIPVSAYFATHNTKGPTLQIYLKDGSKIEATIPVAHASDSGVITCDSQMFNGDKHFMGNISTDGNLTVTGDITAGDSLTVGTVNANAIISATVTGNLNGNANTASKLLAAKTINGTAFDGSANITTSFWGTTRNMKISNVANASLSGVDVNGSVPVTFTIPSTMTGFANITSTNLFGTALGSKTSIWDTLHIENPIIYNPLDNSYFHKLVSKSNSTSGRTLNLPDLDGTLTLATTAVGDEHSPTYVASSGQILACTTIDVDHGGTGRNTIAAGSLMVGNGTNAITLVAGDTKGKILTANGSTAAPSYVSPTLSWVDGAAAGPTLKFSINGADTTSAIPVATGTASGVVTTGEQTFNGKKIFSGAIQGNSTLAITGTSQFTGQITAANMILTGQLKSSANASYSYMTLADAKITLKSSAILLDGSKLLLNSTSSNMYGTTLPTSGLEEGRVFFLLT